MDAQVLLLPLTQEAGAGAGVGGLAGLLRSRSRALLGDLIRPHHRPVENGTRS